MFGLTSEDCDTKFRKQHVVMGNIEIINKHLADQRDQHVGECEKPVTANVIDSTPPTRGRGASATCSESMRACDWDNEEKSTKPK